jgi:hypothetical protein
MHARALRLKAEYEREKRARGGLTTKVESTPEPESEEPTMSDPRIVGITKQIETLTSLIRANHERNRTTVEPMASLKGETLVKGSKQSRKHRGIKMIAG